MVDPSMILPGMVVVLKDGAKITLTGVHLSIQGLILRGKENPASAVERNVPLDQVIDVLRG